MKRIILIFPFLLLHSLLFGQLINKPAASVNLTKPEIITEKQLEARTAQLEALAIKSGLSAASLNRDEVLESMLSEVLLRQGAEEKGITPSESDMASLIQQQKALIEQQVGQAITDEQFRIIVNQQPDVTWDSYILNLKDQLIQQIYISQEKRELFDNIAPPTAAQVEERFSKNATSYVNPEYIRISQIYLSILNKTQTEITEIQEKAEEVLRKLKNGDSTFEDLALQYSDDQQSKFRGGDGGFVSIDDKRVPATFGEHFFSKIFSLNLNQVSDVIKSNVGYHIVKITEHQDPRLLSLVDQIAPDNPMTVSEFIKAGLYQEFQQIALQTAVKEVVADLKKRAEITIF